TGPLAGKAEIMEQDAGLHFLLRLDTPLTDEELRRAAAEKGIRLAFLSDYYHNSAAAPQHVVVVNYSGIEPETLRRGLKRLAELWED
ncbi:MAG: PLP-dependent aminotransferase family protein, partial [Oscillospiraceae bacterium]|nr:PLP-dependent aminotransferase family protein [Oscillospiraceae bacterium]